MRCGAHDRSGTRDPHPQGVCQRKTRAKPQSPPGASVGGREILDRGFGPENASPAFFTADVPDCILEWHNPEIGAFSTPFLPQTRGGASLPNDELNAPSEQSFEVLRKRRKPIAPLEGKRCLLADEFPDFWL